MPVRLRLVLIPLLGLCAAVWARDEVDLAETCLALAVVQEPEVDVEKMKQALADLEERAKKRLDGAKDPKEVVKRLNEVLLGERKVSYLSNKYWRDSTLAASLLRGVGNCLSTSTLYAVIGQRLGQPIHVVIVPGHAFARYDDGEARINIETTNGGVELPEAYYRTMGEWTEDDAASLGYGRSLSAREFAAHLHSYAGRHLQSVDQSEPALEQIEEAVRLWPSNEEYALQRLGLLYATPGRREEALRGYLQLHERGKSPEARVRALTGIASDLQARGQHPEALELLRQAFHDAPKHVASTVLSSMASSYRTLRRFSEALLAQDLALSAQFQPEADDYTLLAIYYKNADLLDDAIRCLYHSVERNPEDWNTRLILAGYLIRAKRDDEGWKMLATVEKPRVDEQFYETNMAWFYGSVGKKAEFLEHLEKALSLATTPDILDYINTEVDFDQYRDAADFQALIDKHRKRLTE